MRRFFGVERSDDDAAAIRTAVYQSARELDENRERRRVVVRAAEDGLARGSEMVVVRRDEHVAIGVASERGEQVDAAARGDGLRGGIEPRFAERLAQDATRPGVAGGAGFRPAQRSSHSVPTSFCIRPS